MLLCRAVIVTPGRGTLTSIARRWWWRAGGEIVWAMGAVQMRRAGDVAEVVLARPAKLNAMNMA